MPRGLFYRGDTRDPIADGIFKYGFKKQARVSRVVTPERAPKFRFPRGIQAAPDVYTSTIVCVTVDFFAASIFPTRQGGAYPPETWIYVLDLDTNKMFNTQQYQANYVDQLYDAGSIVGNQAIKDALWPMFGAERAVNRVEPYEVIGAVQVSRKLNNPGSVLEGGTF